MNELKKVELLLGIANDLSPINALSAVGVILENLSVKTGTPLKDIYTALETIADNVEKELGKPEQVNAPKVKFKGVFA